EPPPPTATRPPRMPQTFWWFSKRDPGVRSQPALRRSAFTGGKRLLDDKKRIQEHLGIATSRAEPENVERRSAAVITSACNRRDSHAIAPRRHEAAVVLRNDNRLGCNGCAASAKRRNVARLRNDVCRGRKQDGVVVSVRTANGHKRRGCHARVGLCRKANGQRVRRKRKRNAHKIVSAIALKVAIAAGIFAQDGARASRALQDIQGVAGNVRDTANRVANVRRSRAGRVLIALREIVSAA